MKQKSDIRVIDNFVKEEHFEEMYKFFTSKNVNWNFFEGISDSDVTAKISYDNSFLDNYFFTHWIYDKMRPQSDCFEGLHNMLNPLFEEYLGCEYNQIVRMKANLYPRTQKINRHPWHNDNPHQSNLKGALLMINTCDGFTGFIDGTKVESVANRIIFFNPNEKHHSTSTTNSSTRITLNVNYL